jgi:hypothetical protein
MNLPIIFVWMVKHSSLSLFLRMENCKLCPVLFLLDDSNEVEHLKVGRHVCVSANSFTITSASEEALFLSPRTPNHSHDAEYELPHGQPVTIGRDRLLYLAGTVPQAIAHTPFKPPVRRVEPLVISSKKRRASTLLGSGAKRSKTTTGFTIQFATKFSRFHLPRTFVF